MASFVYADNSNVWIEGMRVSAVARGFAPGMAAAQTEKIVDYDWKLDFGNLYARCLVRISPAVRGC
jgi:hypothetical protein